MAGKRRNLPITSVKPRRAATLPYTRSLIGAGQIVHRLRARQFAGCEELPDAVIRTTAAKAEKTRESIRYKYQSWKRWLAVQHSSSCAFPAEPSAIARYLQDHSPPIHETRNGGFLVDQESPTASGREAHSHATLQRFLAVLGTLHREAGIEDPTKNPEVQAVWRVLRRGLRKPRQKARLDIGTIWKAVSALPSTIEGKRDRVLLLLAYALMARRSELVALNDRNLERHEDGSMTVRFTRIKTNAEAENHLPREIVVILDEWLSIRPTAGPAIFVRLDRAGGHERLSAGSVADIMRRALRKAGAELDVLTIGSHSARIGAAYDLALAGAADSAIMRDAGWKTAHMVAVYTRGARAREGALANLLANSTPSKLCPEVERED
jgi:integrase/recombinase XerD